MLGKTSYSGNTPKQIGGYGQGQAPDLNVMTPEEKMLRKERRRVESLIVGYSNNPTKYDDAYVLQLEQMASQYQIPFQRANAGFVPNAAAAAGGFVDSFLFDLVPDNWYSSDATASARRVGKGAGLASAALLTGGTSLLGKGMTKFATSGIGRFTTAGAALSAKKTLMPAVAGMATKPGAVGGVARSYMGSGQGKNVAEMAVDDIAASAAKLAKGGKGGRKSAIETIENSGDLLSGEAKVKMAQNTGAVKGKLESDIYSAAQGIGKAAASSGGSKTEVLLSNILSKGKGVGPKTKQSIDAVLKDKNKLKAIEDVLNDPNTDLDAAVEAIKGILPKTVQKKLVSKSEMVKLLTEFYGFSSVGG
tara:strand:- start:830 stop:1915 length:1086 start_codon:yes stop_codon:yes gene_type:complete